LIIDAGLSLASCVYGFFVFTTLAIGVSKSPSTKKNRQKTNPNRLPSVSSQIGWPGSSLARIENIGK
jgi:hypothetical protein